MIYYLFITTLVITFLCFWRKRQLEARHQNKKVFYYFLKNSLEFLVPLVIVTGFYIGLLVFVSAVGGRASLGFLEQLEKTLLKINSFYSAYIKLSVTQVIIILAILYVAELLLISADTSKRVNTAFKKGRLWIKIIYVLIVLLCSFTFFGIQPGEPAADLNVHIKTLRERYTNLRKRTRDVLSKEAASQLVNRVQSSLPPSYHSAISLVGKSDSERSQLRDYYARAQNEYSIKNGAVESVLRGANQSKSNPPQANQTDTIDEGSDLKINETDEKQITESTLRSAEIEIEKIAQEQPPKKVEFPNQEGAKRLILEVPKIFSNKVKSGLFSSLIEEHPLLGPIIDSLFATADDKFKQKLEEAIDRTTSSLVKNPENAQRSINDEASSVVNQTDVKIPQGAIDRSNKVNTELAADLLRIQDAQAQVDGEIRRLENGRADKLIAQLHSPHEPEREEAVRKLSEMGDKLSQEKVNEIISTMRHGTQTWSKFLYREDRCRFFEYKSVRYYAADALEGMKSRYVNEAITQEARRSKSTGTTTKRITDPGWI